MTNPYRNAISRRILFIRYAPRDMLRGMTYRITRNGITVATPTADDARAVFYVYKMAARARETVTLFDERGEALDQHTGERRASFKATRSSRAPLASQPSLF